MADREGLRRVAHAGEEGPPEYIWSALDDLGAERIDHGARAEEDSTLIDRLVEDQIPLTMCPISNRRLQVFPDLRDHNLKRPLDQRAKVTINSDDPSYFGGFIADKYLETATALQLTKTDIAAIARNSIESTFLAVDEKSELLSELEEYVANSG
jgi:adenosine deaminase